MAFEDLMGAVGQWSVSIDATAAIGAALSLKESGQTAPPEVASALAAVVEAAGVGDLDEIPPPQRAVALSLTRLFLHQALDVLENPTREPGWTYDDPAILNGWGRASTMMPMLISAVLPELGDVRDFLDVGSGVGLLAVAAANVWPNATVVGVDQWEPSLQRARENVAQAGLGDRIEIRTQNMVDVDDVDRFDLLWLPTFFLSEDVLETGVARLLGAARPGGWIVLGVSRTAPMPLGAAVSTLNTVRNGGTELDPKRAVELLEKAGWSSVEVRTAPGPAPIQLVVGQRPA
jgi:SAM-dependent methyltransferase